MPPAQSNVANHFDFHPCNEIVPVSVRHVDAERFENVFDFIFPAVFGSLSRFFLFHSLQESADVCDIIQPSYDSDRWQQHL